MARYTSNTIHSSGYREIALNNIEENSVNELIGAIGRVRQAWETVATARAGEDAQLNQMLGIKGGYPEILLRISHWDTKARSWSALSKRKKAIVQQEQKLTEAALAQLIHCLNQHNNGVSWLISNTAFPALLGHIDLAITAMDRILTKESIIAANVMGEQFSSQINRVEAASEVAYNLIDAEVKLRVTCPLPAVPS